MQDDFRIPPIGNDAIRATDDLVRSPTEAEISTSWQVLAGRMDAQEPQPGATRARLGRTNGFMRGRGESGTHTLRRGLWSASVAGAVVLGVILLRPVGRDRPGAVQTYATTATQEGTVTLDDGTRVTLAPRTTLRVERFDQQSRTITVDGGEAYFDVARSANTPFVVRSGPLTTRVLGTAFLVRNAGTAWVRVSVSEGRVRVSQQSHPSAGVVLGPGQVGEAVDSSVHVSAIDDLAPSTEWLRDRVVFHDTQVSTILKALSQWYGYQFRCVDPSLPQKSVTIMVSMQSSARALATLEQILRVSLTVVGDTVTLTPQRGQRSKENLQRIRSYDVWTPTREVGR
jgi:transmembrane sensor